MVQRLLTGEQAIAEDEAGALHDDAAMLMRRIADQHLLHQRWMVELEDVATGSAKMNEVAVERGVLAEKADGAGAEDLAGECAPDEGWAGRPGRAGADAGIESGIWRCVHGWRG